MRGQIPPSQSDSGKAVPTDSWYAAPPGNLVWPEVPSGDGRADAHHVNGSASLPVMTPNLGDGRATLQPWSGDGHGRVNPHVAHPAVGRVPHVSTIPTPKGELWKLVMLVVFFLLWISTASTLLFLYMDRYLFPG